MFAWFYVQRIPVSHLDQSLWRGSLLGLAAIHAALAYLIERTLSAAPLRRDWRYRSAFLASAGLACVHSAVLLLIPGHIKNLLLIPPAIAGAFLGGLAATGVHESLWENNSPPALLIQQEIHQKHQALIGAPASIPPAKRLFDLSAAALGLVLSSPVWLAITFLLWLEDPGPLLFVKNSVGRGGLNFRQFKFRTMVREAENTTGPVLSHEGDTRVLRTGRLLRKTALDELPQLLNILAGEMSFVGPRPQRTVLVREYLITIPEYAERHRVLPGLAGLAQVAGDYYLTPRQKLRFDRLYIRYIGLGFDLKLLLLAFLITFWFRWQKGWNGRLPRRLIRVGSKPAPLLTPPPASAGAKARPARE